MPEGSPQLILATRFDHDSHGTATHCAEGISPTAGSQPAVMVVASFTCHFAGSLSISKVVMFDSGVRYGPDNATDPWPSFFGGNSDAHHSVESCKCVEGDKLSICLWRCEKSHISPVVPRQTRRFRCTNPVRGTPDARPDSSSEQTRGTRVLAKAGGELLQGQMKCQSPLVWPFQDARARPLRSGIRCGFFVPRLPERVFTRDLISFNSSSVRHSCRHICSGDSPLT